MSNTRLHYHPSCATSGPIRLSPFLHRCALLPPPFLLSPRPHTYTGCDRITLSLKEENEPSAAWNKWAHQATSWLSCDARYYALQMRTPIRWLRDLRLFRVVFLGRGFGEKFLKAFWHDSCGSKEICEELVRSWQLYRSAKEICRNRLWSLYLVCRVFTVGAYGKN